MSGLNGGINPSLPASVAGMDVARRSQEAARRRRTARTSASRDVPDPPVEAIEETEAARSLPPDETDGEPHGRPLTRPAPRPADGAGDDDEDRPHVDVIA